MTFCWSSLLIFGLNLTLPIWATIQELNLIIEQCYYCVINHFIIGLQSMKLSSGTLPQRLVPVLTPEGHIMKPDGVSIWNHILWCHCYQWAVLCCSAAVKERVKSTPKLHILLQISANVRLGGLMFDFHNYLDTIREVPSLEIFSRRHSQRSVLRSLQSKRVRYF